MPADASIYSNVRPLDIGGAINQGLNMTMMLNKMKQNKIKNKDAQDLRNAYDNTPYTIDVDGKSKTLSEFDRKQITLGNLAHNPFMADKLRNKFQLEKQKEEKARIEQQSKFLELKGRYYGNVKDQDELNEVNKKLFSLGMTNQNTLTKYSKKGIDDIVYKSSTEAQKINNMFRQAQAGFRSRQANINQSNRDYQIVETKRKERESLSTPYGLARTVGDAKILKSGAESYNSFKRGVSELIGLREQYGVEYYNRDAVTRGKQLSKQLLLQYKDMAKLGVLSAADEKILNAIIPSDPLGQDFNPSGDSILHKLIKFKQDVEDDFQFKLKTRLRSNDGSKLNHTKNLPKKLRLG
jgi:hypothetical protein